MNFEKNLIIIIFYLNFARCTDKNVSSPVEEESLASSIATMVNLLQLEGNLYRNLQNYVDILEQKLQVLKMAHNKMKEGVIRAEPNGESYLSNPLNSFALMRRMHNDWPKWLEFLTRNHTFTTNDSDHKMPTSRDLNETITSMFLMQVVYDLKPKDMAGGLLNGKQYDFQLSALDCFAIGGELFNEHKHSHAAEWLKVSIDRFSADDLKFYKVSGFNVDDVYRMLAKAYLELDRFAEAEEIIEILSKSKSIEAEISDLMIEFKRIYLGTYYEEYIDNCRRKFKSNSRFYCRYNTTASPFLRLAPAKMEELRLNPYMFLIHDMIYDNEIEELKTLSRSKLRESGRGAKSHYLPHYITATVERINHRIADITGLSMIDSEYLLIHNYGISGQFEVHYDYFINETLREIFNAEKFGDRIMTGVIYLNDMDQGGATVFPLANIAISPQKGSGLFWYNLHNSGNQNVLSAHGSCPVIVGSKWVAAKWIRVNAQMFQNKCYQNERN